MKATLSIGMIVVSVAFNAPLARAADTAECVVVNFTGTAENILEPGKAQMSIHVTCDSRERVVLGPPLGKKPIPHPTYARITSLLFDDRTTDTEYVNFKGVPLDQVPVCLKETKGDDDDATYEAVDPIQKTKFQIKLTRKDLKPKDCPGTLPCFRYAAEIRLDKGDIDNTSESSCVFTTTFEIIEQTLPFSDGTCLDGAVPTLKISKPEALWANKDTKNCSPVDPGLRYPVELGH